MPKAIYSDNTIDNQSDLGGREAASITDSSPNFNDVAVVSTVAHPTSAAIAVNPTTTTRHSIVSSRHGGNGSGHQPRESFAAALWNPMAEEDKRVFNQKRLIQLFAGVLIFTCAGSTTAFGLISHKLKETANFTQSQLTTITTAGAVIGSLSFPGGVLYDYMGPRPVLALATVFMASGFALLALIFKGTVEPTVVTVSVANGLTAFGIGFTDCGTLITNLFNFPISRGEVLIIQKTFYGLGSTFLSLSFDGFFAKNENYIGYAAYVSGMMLIAGTFGTIVHSLPKYKRTTRELSRIANCGDVIQQEMERQVEERSFEMFHNPRLVDRRRLNAGVTCLLLTLAFFSAFSVSQAYVEIPDNILTGLTVLACVCLLSFAVMIVPCRLPKFFDYDFLPDIHAPDELVDDVGDESSYYPSAAPKDGGVEERNHLLAVNDDGGDEEVVGNTNSKKNSHIPSFGINTDDDHHNGGSGDNDDGRASAFLAQRVSIAGNSAPIAVPEAVDPMVIPSITTPFLTSVRRPMLWCFWYSHFALFAFSGVLMANQSQIITSANGGVFDTSLNSLAVALTGVGSALGRVITGYIEIYLHRQNSILLEEQLRQKQDAYENQQKQNGGDSDEKNNSDDTSPQFTPIYHRWNSSILWMLPLCPLVFGAMVFMCTFCPVHVYPALFFVMGGSFGSFFSLLALGIREIFSCDVAKHYNFVSTSALVSSVVLNRVMFGTWYDAAAESQKSSSGDVNSDSCAGVVCFANALYVIGALNMLAIATTSYIVYAWWIVRKTF